MEEENIRRIANEELDKRRKVKKGTVFGDPVAEIE